MRLPFFLAKRFVAGETLSEALSAVHHLTDSGLGVTLDLLGEYVDDRSVAEEATGSYVHLAHVLAEERDRTGTDIANISIKLSMMGQKIDEAFCRENLHRLLSAASERDVFVRLDMEGSDLTQSTISIFEEVYPQYAEHVGIVLQAYLKRTAEDVERMCELNARVRICKGAYNEPGNIAYHSMPLIREKFMDYTRTLILHSRYPAVATHDASLISAVKAFAAENGIPPGRYEFQFLYGMRPETQRQLVREGYNVRIYVPYGSEWFAYFYRRLRERKENVWFVLSNLFKR